MNLFMCNTNLLSFFHRSLWICGWFDVWMSVTAHTKCSPLTRLWSLPGLLDCLVLPSPVVCTHWGVGFFLITAWGQLHLQGIMVWHGQRHEAILSRRNTKEMLPCLLLAVHNKNGGQYNRKPGSTSDFFTFHYIPSLVCLCGHCLCGCWISTVQVSKFPAHFPLQEKDRIPVAGSTHLGGRRQQSALLPPPRSTFVAHPSLSGNL